MKEQFIKHIESHGHRYVTFPELCDAIEGFAGDLSYGATESAPKRVIWDGLSQEAIDLIEDSSCPGVYLHPCAATDYSEKDRPNLPDEWSLLNAPEPFDPHQAFWMPMAFRNEPY